MVAVCGEDVADLVVLVMSGPDEHVGRLQGGRQPKRKFRAEHYEAFEEDLSHFYSNFDRSTGKRMSLAVGRDLDVKLLPIEMLRPPVC